ncbi:MAG: hypothetical protein ACLUSU_07820 [Collinsella sp.]
MNDTISSPEASPMFYVGSSDYYFAVPKSRPDLMDDINCRNGSNRPRQPTL